MAQLVALFISHLSAEVKAETTTGHYAEVLYRFEGWLLQKHHLSLSNTDVQDINGLILVEYYQELHKRSLKTSTRNNYIVVLKKFFRFLIDTGVITDDPTRALHCVKEKRLSDDGDDKEYTPEQIKTLLELLAKPDVVRNNTRDTAIVALMLGSGLRASELCSLNVSDAVHIRNGQVSCKRKGKGCSKVEIAGFVWPYIDRYLWQRGKCAPDEPLFLSQKGNRMNRNSLWKSLHAKQQSIGIPSGIHRFRHTFTSDVDRNPIGGAAVSRDLAGHSSVAITNTYLHSNHKERQQVVNSMGYAELFDS